MGGGGLGGGHSGISAVIWSICDVLMSLTSADFPKKISRLVEKNPENLNRVYVLVYLEPKSTRLLYLSMTQLLSHTFAHLTGPSFR